MKLPSNTILLLVSFEEPTKSNKCDRFFFFTVKDKNLDRWLQIDMVSGNYK